MNDPTKKKMLLLLVALAIVIVLTLGWLFTKDSPDSSQTQPTPSSQQTAPVGESEAISFIGLSALIDKGVTADQSLALQSAFSKHFIASDQKIKSVTITDTEHVHDPNAITPTQTMYFSAQADRTIYKARMEYFNLSSVRLYLHDQSDKQVFDSGTVTYPPTSSQ